jgi:hypothetical protein
VSERKLVKDAVVRLDYSTLQDTTYEDCKLVFEGGRPPVLINCSFVRCEFVLDGPALNTQAFLTMLARTRDGADLVVNGMLGLSWGPK